MVQKIIILEVLRDMFGHLNNPKSVFQIWSMALC